MANIFEMFGIILIFSDAMIDTQLSLIMIMHDDHDNLYQ